MTPARSHWCIEGDSLDGPAERGLATKNSERPETGAFAAEFSALCSEGPTFREFDIVTVFGE